MIDTSRNKGQRLSLIKEIAAQGITDENVLRAMNKLPRHFFLEKGFEEFAYMNKAFSIGAGQTISQPYTVAFQTQLLEIKKGDKVLEIGTGSGYQTAILVELGAKVYTIERQRELYLKARALLSKLGYRPQFFYGDGYKGKASYGPFDKIIVTAGAPYIPKELQLQLAVGGILVIPVGDSETQIMYCGNFVFVPLLEGKQ